MINLHEQIYSDLHSGVNFTSEYNRIFVHKKKYIPHTLIQRNVEDTMLKIVIIYCTMYITMNNILKRILQYGSLQNIMENN